MHTISRRPLTITKEQARAQLEAALEKYTGEITHCPPGVAYDLRRAEAEGEAIKKQRVAHRGRAAAAGGACRAGH